MEQRQKSVEVPGNFLSKLLDSDRNELYRIGKMRTFAKNDFLFKAGEEDLNVWILTRGRVKLFGSSAQGRDVLLLFTLAGDIFGLAECIQEQPRLIYARAAEMSEALCIPHTQFKAWLSTRPEIAYCLMQIMAARMRELGQRFLSLANGNIRMEIAQLLVRLGAVYGNLVGQYIHVGIPLTVQDIADMAGASRQGVSTCLAEMKRQGIVDCVQHFMIIKRLETLHQIADGKSVPTTGEHQASKRDWQSLKSFACEERERQYK